MATRRNLPQAWGFTMTEVLLSVTIWGMIIVPFVAFYGQLQRNFYSSQRSLSIMAASRATFDQVSQDVRRIADPSNTVGSATPTSICFKYTPVSAGGTDGTTQFVSYRWDGKKMYIKRSSGSLTLASFCTTSGESVLTALGAEAYIESVGFSYYTATGDKIADGSVSTNPVNFRRVGMSLAFDHPGAGQDFSSQALVAPGNLMPKVQSVAISPDSATVIAGVTPTTQMSAVVQLDDGTLDTNGVLWQSMNPTIASIDTNGLVTGLQEGTTSIQACAKRDPSICDPSPSTIIVQVRVASMSVTPSSATVTAGVTSTTLTGTVTLTSSTGGVPNTETNITWSCQSGCTNVSFSPTTGGTSTVSGLHEGSAVVRATSNRDTSKFVDVPVTVLVAVNSVTVASSPSPANIKAGVSGQSTATLTADVTLSSGDHETNVAWSCQSGCGNVSLSSGSGATTIVTGLHEGTAVVRATSNRNTSKYADTTITVGVIVSSISQPSNATIKAGVSGQNTATLSSVVLLSSGDTETSITWLCQSGCSNVSFTPASGGSTTVTGLLEGTAVIRARSNRDTSFFKDATITVQVNVNSVAITSPTSTPTLYVGISGSNTVTANAIVTLSNGVTEANINWSASPSGYVSLSSTTGASTTVTAQVAGTVTLTATSGRDSSKSASITINVQPGVSSVTIAPSAGQTIYTAGTRRTVTLAGTVNLSNSTTETDVSWTTSNAGIASLAPNTDGTVVVTGNAAGSVTITCTSNRDSSKKSTLTVTVVTLAATAVSISPGSQSLNYGSTLQLSATVTLNDGTTEASVSWGSSNPTKASVNTSGLVSGNQGGSATISATSTRTTSVSASITITVNAVPSSVTISGGTTTVYTTRSYGGFTATVNLNDGTTGGSVTWFATDSAQLTVSPSGNTASIVGNYPNGTNLCARANADTSIQACVSITIITLAASSFTLYVNGTTDLDPFFGTTTTQVVGYSTLNDGSREDLVSTSSWSTNDAHLYVNGVGSNYANISSQQYSSGGTYTVSACSDRNTSLCQSVNIRVRGCYQYDSGVCIATGTCYHYDACCSTDAWGACVADGSCGYTCCTATRYDWSCSPW